MYPSMCISQNTVWVLPLCKHQKWTLFLVTVMAAI